MSFATRSAAAGSPSGEPRERLVGARRCQNFLSSREVLLRNEDLQRATARHAVHRADAEIGSTLLALDSFGSKERAKYVRLVFGRHKREVHGLGHLAHRPQPLVEADARRMDVEQACAVWPRVRKRVYGSERCGDERAGTETERFAADEELGLAVEHVEGVDVVVVAVWVRSHEARLELELDQGDLFAPDLDGRNPHSRHLKSAACMRVVYAAGSDTGHNNWCDLRRLREVVIATWLSAVQPFN